MAVPNARLNRSHGSTGFPFGTTAKAPFRDDLRISWIMACRWEIAGQVMIEHRAPIEFKRSSLAIAVPASGLLVPA